MTRTRRWWPIRAMIPAALAVVVTVIALLLSLDRTVITGDAEWKTVELADGSLARVAPFTELRFEFTRQRRLVRLSGGQAMFYVRKDALRPFLVETETATAQAIGTAFGVTQLAPGRKVTVTVREGVVAVAERSHPQDVAALPSGSIPLVRIVAGEQAIIDNAHPIEVRIIDLSSELGWAEERLVLKGTLGDAVREFNLRNHHQLIVTDPAIERTNLRGIMDAWNPQALVATLESMLHVRAVRRGDETFLMPPLPEGKRSTRQPPLQPQQEL